MKIFTLFLTLLLTSTLAYSKPVFQGLPKNSWNKGYVTCGGDNLNEIPYFVGCMVSKNAVISWNSFVFDKMVDLGFRSFEYRILSIERVQGGKYDKPMVVIYFEFKETV